MEPMKPPGTVVRELSISEACFEGIPFRYYLKVWTVMKQNPEKMRELLEYFRSCEGDIYHSIDGSTELWLKHYGYNKDFEIKIE